MNVNNSNEDIREGSAIWNNTSSNQIYFLDDMTFKIMLSGEHTNGKYSLIEILFPYGDDIKEIPLHAQTREIVIVYVMEGKFLIKYGQKNINCNNGMIIKLERNIPRSFMKLGKEEGRLLVLYIPSGFEKFFKDVGSINIMDFKKSGDDEPILTQLLEKTYGARMIYEDP